MISLKDWLPTRGREDLAILKTLQRFSRHKTSVQIEIEGRQVHFRSVLAIKRGMVVMARPKKMPGVLRKGSAVRMTDPDGKRPDLRMVILHPHFILTTGGDVFLCRIPTEYAPAQLRASKRFDVGRFEDAAVVFPDGGMTFKLLDISLTGCRLNVPTGNAKILFPLEEHIPGLLVKLGPLRIKLATLEPRAYVGKTVGCNIQVAQDAIAGKSLEHLLATLDSHEQKRYRAALHL